MIFVIAANNVNSFFLRNVGVEPRTNVKCSKDHIVWNLRVFNKVDEVGSVFNIGLLEIRSCTGVHVLSPSLIPSFFLVVLL